MDRQLGKLFDYVRAKPCLRDNTLILVCSDNGPELGAGVAGPFRGYKTHLFEGGIRSSLVAWAPGLIPSKKNGTVDKVSVFSAIDLVPSLLQLTKANIPKGQKYDGEPLLNTLLGKSQNSRTNPIYFRRPPDRDSFYGVKDLPDLALRHKNWKFLCEYDGSDPLLYDMSKDIGETQNLAKAHPDLVKQFSNELIQWHKSMPPDNGDK